MLFLSQSKAIKKIRKLLFKVLKLRFPQSSLMPQTLSNGVKEGKG